MIDNKTRQRTSSQNFLKGAFVLTLGMIAVKLCGLAQKVLLTNLYSELGGNFAEFGTALFSNAYELYVPLFTLATVGFPVAVSRLISESFAKERYKDIKQIYKIAKPFFTLTGLLCFLFLYPIYKLTLFLACNAHTFANHIFWLPCVDLQRLL